jgi:hypothetical protein
VSTRTASRRTCTIAGARPLELLTRSEDRWWTSRASVWDHCHEHDLVRGPLTELTHEFLQVRWPLR